LEKDNFLFQEVWELANHKSAVKRARQSEERRIRNRAQKTRMKNAIKGVEEAISSSTAETATEKLREAISVIHQTAQKGVIHRKKASRKISRLSLRVNNLVSG
jgi:small subunit ribosomal protein S20